MQKASVAIAIAILAGGASASHATSPFDLPRSYVGIAGGRADFSEPKPTLPVSEEKQGLMGKLYGGFRFTDNFGVEVGYSRLGSFSRRLMTNGEEVRQKGIGSSFYAAMTGRMPLGESFAVNCRLGLSSGKFSATGEPPAGEPVLAGTKRSALVGIGAEYRFSPQFSLNADYDYYGKLSNSVKAGALMFGARMSF
ncbi:MAG: outer membrane beta-barrel protein [Steroidobacteraceae bacterium]